MRTDVVTTARLLPLVYILSKERASAWYCTSYTRAAAAESACEAPVTQARKHCSERWQARLPGHWPSLYPGKPSLNVILQSLRAPGEIAVTQPDAGFGVLSHGRLSSHRTGNPSDDRDTI